MRLARTRRSGEPYNGSTSAPCGGVEYPDQADPSVCRQAIDMGRYRCGDRSPSTTSLLPVRGPVVERVSTESPLKKCASRVVGFRFRPNHSRAVLSCV